MLHRHIRPPEVRIHTYHLGDLEHTVGGAAAVSARNRQGSGVKRSDHIALIVASQLGNIQFPAGNQGIDSATGTYCSDYYPHVRRTGLFSAYIFNILAEQFGDNADRLRFGRTANHLGSSQGDAPLFGAGNQNRNQQRRCKKECFQLHKNVVRVKNQS